MVNCLFRKFHRTYFYIYLIYYGHVLDLYDKNFNSAINLAFTKVNMSFRDVFVEGILCNTLILVFGLVLILRN